MTDDLSGTLQSVVACLDAAGIPYMVVGSVAALAHGRTRSTQDLDMVVEIDIPGVAALVKALPAGRFYVDEDVARDAIRRSTLFNVLDTETGWKLDFIPRKSRAFSRTEFARREHMRVLGVTVSVATLEDIVISKLEWAKLGSSERQLEDAWALIGLAGTRLDVGYVEEWIHALDLVEQWRAVRTES